PEQTAGRPPDPERVLGAARLRAAVDGRRGPRPMAPLDRHVSRLPRRHRAVADSPACSRLYLSGRGALRGGALRTHRNAVTPGDGLHGRTMPSHGARGAGSSRFITFAADGSRASNGRGSIWASRARCGRPVPPESGRRSARRPTRLLTVTVLSGVTDPSPLR